MHVHAKAIYVVGRGFHPLSSCRTPSQRQCYNLASSTDPSLSCLIQVDNCILYFFKRSYTCLPIGYLSSWICQLSRKVFRVRFWFFVLFAQEVFTQWINLPRGWPHYRFCFTYIWGFKIDSRKKIERRQHTCKMSTFHKVTLKKTKQKTCKTEALSFFSKIARLHRCRELHSALK